MADAPNAIEALPDDLRIPLHSLQADTRYLFGRVAQDGSVADAMATSAAERLSQVETAAATTIKALQAENARLREALRSIAEGNLGDAPWQANYLRIREAARAALSGGAS